jgi:hypothetical protein
MKKIVLGFIVGVMVTLSITTYAASGIRLVIDGVDITSTLEAPPIIVNDRTMVPIRAIVENFGAEVGWEPTTSTVVITSPEKTVQAPATSNPSSSSGTSSSVTGGIPMIYSVTANGTIFDTGEKATIKVTANRAAMTARITDTSGKTLAESDDYDSDSQGNYFTLEVPLDTEGDIELRAQVGTESGSYSSASKSIEVIVNDGEPEDGELEIISAKLDDSEVDEGDTIYVTVETTSNVEEVEIRTSTSSSSGSEIDRVTSAETETASKYTWELEIDTEDMDGKETLYVFAYDDDDNEVRKTVTFEVNGNSGSSYSLDLVDVEYDNNVEVGDEVDVVVITSDDVTRVEILDEDDNTVDYATSSDENSDGDLEWELELDDVSSSDDNGTYYYTVVLIDDDDNEKTYPGEFNVYYE